MRKKLIILFVFILLIQYANAQLKIKLSNGTDADNFLYYNGGTIVLGLKSLTVTDNQIGLQSNNDFYINNYAGGNGNVWIGKSAIGTTTVLNNFVVGSTIMTGSKNLWITDNQIGLQSNNDFYINNYSGSNGNVWIGKSAIGTTTVLNNFVVGSTIMTGSKSLWITDNQIGLQSNNDFYINNYAGGNGNVWIGKSGTGTITAMNNFTVSGNVGIGIAPSDAKLDVEGTIRAHEVKVCLTKGCDFVFNKDYKLRSIEDLDNFIKTNKHLPDIAPAVDMESNGISLSDMNAKLLQKIEEQSLYIIEMNKRIVELENRIK